MSDHIEGRPVSATTYQYHGCRCDECTAAASAKMRIARSKRDGALVRVQSRQQTLLLAWARERISSEELEALRAEAYEYCGVDRRSRGLPPKVQAS